MSIINKVSFFERGIVTSYYFDDEESDDGDSSEEDDGKSENQIKSKWDGIVFYNSDKKQSSVFISNDKSCCESWSVSFSQDDHEEKEDFLTKLLGATIISIGGTMNAKNFCGVVTMKIRPSVGSIIHHMLRRSRLSQLH